MGREHDSAGLHRLMRVYVYKSKLCQFGSDQRIVNQRTQYVSPRPICHRFRTLCHPNGTLDSETKTSIPGNSDLQSH